MECSVIISTCNRSASLEKTLRVFGEIYVPSGWKAEVIVVDNASADQTAAVVQKAVLNSFSIRYLYEARPGKSNALNSGLALAQGAALLFTDDDVVPAKDWLVKFSTPLLQRQSDVVVGRIRLAEHLLRPWMQPIHRLWLAAPDDHATITTELIGANMGFHRSVFDRIPQFDPELGPGASGLGEETLFALQLEAAGFHVHPVPDAVVVHHPDSSRLRRSQWLAGSRKHGRTQAYILHHWEHGELNMPHLRRLYFQFKLSLRRLIQRPPPLEAEGCPPWELSYVAEIEKCLDYICQRKRPRNYVRHGLRKLTAQNPSSNRSFRESVGE